MNWTGVYSVNFLRFWFLDSVAYYYQVKLRGIMESIRDRLRDRHKEETIYGVEQISIIGKQRVTQSQFRRIMIAFFNHLS